MTQAVATVSYFKRYKMEIDLNDLPPPLLLPGFSFVPWDHSLLDLHATVLAECFAQEIDAIVFPSLGNRTGCGCLMMEICRKSGFQPEATWLLTNGSVPCGTVQGVRERYGLGAIQNLGITPTQRGRGLGEALLLQALHGFYRAGLGRAVLEVTAQNEGAIRLYRRVGFRRTKTLYKAVPTFRLDG
jgi:ribosomal protein S18 acetylase RimI-like enzyme